MANQPVTWREAWEHALYGEGGFFRTSRPGDHFRTNVHVGPFADAIAEVVRRTSAPTVVDLGAGGGELLLALDALLPDVELIGVDLAERPAGLPERIDWRAALPDRIDGLLIANEWLDNVPCAIVEVDDDGVPRELLIDPDTGVESPGEPFASGWLWEWWTLGEPGERAEVGLARDLAWADAVSRVHGTAIAIDYGHVRDDRPPFGTLTSYAAGREVDVRLDGTRDVTAHVAVDSAASASGGRLVRQRDALIALGVDGRRPPHEVATTDPAAYVRALGQAGEAAELLARGGLGDFWWIVCDTADHGRLDV